MHKEHEHLQKPLELLANIQHEVENGHGFELATTVAFDRMHIELVFQGAVTFCWRRGKEMRLSWRGRDRKWLGFARLRVVVCGDVCWISARTRVIIINLG